jgi:hypothetical protein
VEIKIDQANLIATAKRNLEDIKIINSSFLENVKSGGVAGINRVSAKLEVENQKIIVDFFDFKAIASPRFVKSSTVNVAGVPCNMFLVEYIFFTNFEDAYQEIWRFYLDGNGTITKDFQAKNNISTYSNTHIAEKICTELLASSLISPIFSPTKPNKIYLTIPQ